MYRMMFVIRALALHLLMTRTTWIAAAYKPSVVFPVSGNVYPEGNYRVTINIGGPSVEYTIDIDTGSDLTWLQCGIPGATNVPAPHDPYSPTGNGIGGIVSCMHYLCVSLQPDGVPNCGADRHCHYEIQYADSGSSLGLLVYNNAYLTLTNGTVLETLTVFGCGYYQAFPAQVAPPFVDGILGLGKGKVGILNQLQRNGVMENINGHCFSSQGGGYLALGDSPRIDGIVWKSVLTTQDHYMMGLSDLYFDNQVDPTTTDLQVIFDSGSTYTYFSSQAYEDLLTKIKADLGTQLEIANDDPTLPVCWKAAQPFTLITDANTYFKTLNLKISDNIESATFEMDPKSYMILSNKGNLCLGILKGGIVGIGDEMSVIGDISMQDKWMVYDNQNSRVGWVAANCSVSPQF